MRYSVLGYELQKYHFSECLSLHAVLRNLFCAYHLRRSLSRLKRHSAERRSDLASSSRIRDKGQSPAIGDLEHEAYVLLFGINRCFTESRETECCRHIAPRIQIG